MNCETFFKRKDIFLVRKVARKYYVQPVGSVAAKFLLVNIPTKQLHVPTTTVKLLLMLNRELEH